MAADLSLFPVLWIFDTVTVLTPFLKDSLFFEVRRYLGGEKDNLRIS